MSAAATGGTAPSLKADIVIDIRAAGWQEILPAADALCREAVGAALAVERLSDTAMEISLVLDDDAAIRVLNRDWRDRDSATDVLSFPCDDAPPSDGAPRMLGDVIVALETMTRDADAASVSYANHLSHLIIHGIFHLLGYDHEQEEEAEEMESLEADALALLGIANPYDAVLAG